MTTAQMIRHRWLKIRLQQCTLAIQGKGYFIFSQEAHSAHGDGYLYFPLGRGENLGHAMAIEGAVALARQLRDHYRAELEKLPKV